MYAEIVILASLGARPQHGYEIKKTVERALGGSISLNNKVLYPALRRFEEMGAVEREVERQEGKPDRHIYRLTERGGEALQGLLQDVSPDLLRSDAEFLVRVAFFHLLEPGIRLEILRIRAELVAKDLAHIQELKVLAQRNMPDSYAVRVALFHEQQQQHELGWIQTLIQEIQQEQEGKNYEQPGNNPLAERHR
jgi:DNA-binding PadR family transcriptional regulator